MKKLLFLLALLAAFSCNNREMGTESTLSGIVEKHADTPVMLYLGNETDTLVIAEDGRYSISKELERGATFTLRAGRNYSSVYLAPGYNLTANFNAEDLPGSIVFEGELALENNYSKEMAGLNQELTQGMYELFESGPEEFREGVLKIKETKDDFLNNYLQANPDIEPGFIEYERINYEFSYYYALSSYEAYHKSSSQDGELNLPENWFDFEDKIELDRTSYLNVPSALRIVSNIMGKEISEDGGPGKEAWGSPELLGAQFEWILKNINTTEVKDYLLRTNLLTVLDYAGPHGIEQYISSYYENSTDQESIEEIKGKVEIWAPLTSGNEAPGFTLPGIDGRIYSLSDFAGKYVYIDFWATWCGPCKIEIPILEKLALKYADKNIEIISISVDQDKQAWIDMVKRDRPGWLQLHDGINMNDDYLISFIPSFILIDREGKILQARAPRPSSGEVLVSLLDSLEGI